MFCISEYVPYWDFKTSHTTPTPGVVFQLARANPRRPLLYVACPAGVEIWLDCCPRPTLGGTPWGIVGPGFLRFTWTIDGPLSTFGWWGVVTDPGTPVSIAWWEGFWHPPTDPGAV